MAWVYHNKPPMGWPLDLSEPINDGLGGYWYMPEGSGNIIRDLSGNENHSPAFGNSVTWVAGKFGSVLNFTNAGAGVPISSSSLLKPGTGDMTWIVWVDMDADNGGDDFFADRPLGAFGTQEGYFWGAGGDSTVGSLQFALEASDNNYKQYQLDGGAYTVAEGLIQFAVTWNNASDTLLIYKNEVDVTSLYNKINDDNLSGKSIANSSDFIIGARPGGAREIDGRISHVPIYNRTLSASEIALLYRFPFYGFFNPDEIPVLDQYYTVSVGGIMTPNTGYWGAI